jgi:hypothetical protein
LDALRLRDHDQLEDGGEGGGEGGGEEEEEVELELDLVSSERKVGEREGNNGVMIPGGGGKEPPSPSSSPSSFSPFYSPYTETREGGRDGGREGGREGGRRELLENGGEMTVVDL